MGDPLGGWGASGLWIWRSTPYWIAMIEGVVRMLFPTAFARIEAGIGQNAGAIIAAAVVLALLGAMLIAFWP